MNPHTGRDFVQFGKTESVLNKGAKKIALLFNPPPVLSLVIMPKYQREQEELKKQLSALQEQSAEHDATEQNAGKWISLIRQYSDLKELNSCIINELITKILVGDKRRVNGEKVQSIEIHYRFIGNLTDSGNGETIQ